MPHTGQSYHSTSHTLKPITVSHSTPTHTHRCEAHTSRFEQTLCFSFFLSHTHSISFTQTKKQTASLALKTPFGLSVKECQKEFPDTSQTAKQLPVWENTANSVFTGGKIHTGGSSVVHARPRCSVRVPASENRTSDELPHTVPALKASERIMHTGTTCSCQSVLQ